MLSRALLSTPERSTLVDVAMTYRAFTRRIGTPLTLKGPVIKRAPCDRCLRRMTRLPLKRPARRMRIVPGSRALRYVVGRTDLRAWRGWMLAVALSGVWIVGVAGVMFLSD